MAARGRNGERGAAAVEFALLLPLLMTILLGSIDWGYFFFVEQIVTNASREGARAGSLTPFDATKPALDATAKADASSAATGYLTTAGLKDPGALVTVVAADSVTVTVSYPTGSITGFKLIAALLPARANAVAQMRR